MSDLIQENLEKTAASLHEYAVAEGTEWGDYCLTLCSIADHEIPSETFKSALLIEMRDHLLQFQKDYDLVEIVETKKVRYTELKEKASREL